jgi:glycosyltransferase involved in cell wall biosynthesis
MKICLISVEIFAWGKYGGFGRATRTIGRELAKRGHQVCAIVPRRKEQQEIEQLDGMTVYGFNPYWPFSAIRLIKQSDADIYHSCEPSLISYLAKKVMPAKKHMVTIRDPRDWSDWKMEFDLPSLSKIQVLHNYLFENNPLVKRIIPAMDAVYTTARCLLPKVNGMYRLKRSCEFLPTPVAMPEDSIKAERPTVCYLARFDRRKRPELFLDLAEKFPYVDFIAMGKSRDKEWDTYLRDKYKNIPNLEMTGFVDQFTSDLHSQILARSWIMVNTATRESLPNAFIESAAHKCAVLSHVNPDNFASEFGYHAINDEFSEGLEYLLEDNHWKALGEKGYSYINETFEQDKSISHHIRIYEALLAEP